jgi:hypothetical protein
LALRLRDAAAPPDVICEYLAVPEDRLEVFYRMAEAKFADAQHMSTQLCATRSLTAETAATSARPQAI